MCKPLNVFADNKVMQNGFVVTDDLRTNEIINEGAEDKFFIKLNGQRYLVKDSSFNKRRKQASLAPYCEYVGSNFIKRSELLDCQQCYLGFYQDRIVVICEDAFQNGVFRPFRDLHESSAGTSLANKEYTYDDVLYVLKQKEELSNVDHGEFFHKFWLMFLFDAILGNRDRHEGNWGFVKKSACTAFAPIIDNGSSLFPDVDLTNWHNYDFIKTRVLKMPASQFRMWKAEYTDRAMRTNFYEMLRDFSSSFFKELEEIRSINYKNLLTFDHSLIPGYAWEWFTTIIECRFRCLILNESYDNVFSEMERKWND